MTSCTITYATLNVAKYPLRLVAKHLRKMFETPKEYIHHNLVSLSIIPQTN